MIQVKVDSRAALAALVTLNPARLRTHLTDPFGSQMLGSKHIAQQVESRIAQKIQAELERVF